MISRRYRNRRIGDFLKELKLVEGRNTGIPTILRAMDANGSQPPVFETDAERTYFTVILPVHESFLQEADIAKTQGKAKRRSLAEIKTLILDTLKVCGNLSATELAAAMGYAKVSGTIGKAIKELLAEGKVVYSEPDRIHSRNQKICLVECSNVKK